MISSLYKKRIQALQTEYARLMTEHQRANYEITLAEIPEMVYHSNAIENSSLTLEDTEDIILEGRIRRGAKVREIYEAKNLADVIHIVIENPRQRLSLPYILSLHRILMSGIDDSAAGRFRMGGEQPIFGQHIGANPDFTNSLISQLIDQYKSDRRRYFLEKIAYFHAEFEDIHPFIDGNGHIGRVLINQQLQALGYPPIIIQSKNKDTDYHELFDEYHRTDSLEEFIQLFTLALIESLHKRITLLSESKTITIREWAEKNRIAQNAALNKARRQTIPAFRQNKVWLIRADFKDNAGVELY
jgi:Fic family protein